MEIVYPSVLILASRFDLSCDYVISQLRKRDCKYIRINSEDLSELKINLNPIDATLTVISNDIKYYIDKKLKSVYYRRPVFLREYNVTNKELNEHFYKQQWASFIRNLMVFDESYWMNHPSSTYYAEHKAIQLQVASKIGFKIPQTEIGNFLDKNSSFLSTNKEFIIKGIDTILIRDGSLETFGYSEIINYQQIDNANLSVAPITFQKLLSPKIDIRVTVIGEQVFAAKISLNHIPITGDWRQHKDNVLFERFNLPSEVQNQCINLLRKFNLNYGAIDLALVDETFFFLEINPTGEWAWLIKSADLPIDVAIANSLISQGLSQ